MLFFLYSICQPYSEPLIFNLQPAGQICRAVTYSTGLSISIEIRQQKSDGSGNCFQLQQLMLPQLPLPPNFQTHGKSPRPDDVSLHARCISAQGHSTAGFKSQDRPMPLIQPERSKVWALPPWKSSVKNIVVPSQNFLAVVLWRWWNAFINHMSTNDQ